MYLGIDFAFSPQKRLPFALIHSNVIGNDSYKIISVSDSELPPFGKGLTLLFNEKEQETQLGHLEHWIKKMVAKYKIKMIALDCPTIYCPDDIKMRISEQQVRKSGCGIFKTPTETDINQKITEAKYELLHGHKKAHSGFSIWMKFAIDFAAICKKYTSVIEVFPNYFWKSKLGANHKKLEGNLQLKRDLLALNGIINPEDISKYCTGNLEDKIDAAYCALVAAHFYLDSKVGCFGDDTDRIYFLK